MVVLLQREQQFTCEKSSLITHKQTQQPTLIVTVIFQVRQYTAIPVPSPTTSWNNSCLGLVCEKEKGGKPLNQLISHDCKRLSSTFHYMSHDATCINAHFSYCRALVQSPFTCSWLTCIRRAVIGFYVVSRKGTPEFQPPPTCEPHRYHHAQRVERETGWESNVTPWTTKPDVAQRIDSGAERRCPRQVLCHLSFMPLVWLTKGLALF